jgi:AraC family transcriptional regulator of adaptative response/methylated-DNA-[protein]-cysteine methyltransferase
MLDTMMQNKPAPFRTDDERWGAVRRRDPAADGAFYYSVATTGVYCRPTCGARLPRRENVAFHATRADAERAGFRACKRCRPNESGLAERHAGAVSKACRMIETAEEVPSLGELAQSAGMSPYHFHRIFRAAMGVSPKGYAAAVRAKRVRNALAERGTVTQALYGAGFNSNGPFYAGASGMLGMTPRQFRTGGPGTVIRFAVGECSLGSILVAATEKGDCAIELGDDPASLVRLFEDRFHNAELVGDDPEFAKKVSKIVGFVETPGRGLDLPLDIRGTAFQQRVWDAIAAIPSGSTATYAELAKRIGAPKAVRAVANACASNAIAIAIPCHRVVRSDGSPSGYRWGVARKRALLARESASQERAL